MQPNQTNYPSNNAYGAGQPAMPPAQATFADPTAGGGSALKVRHLEGRTCVFVPTGYNPAARGMNPTDPPRPTVTTDVLVLDGPELYFGDNATTGQGFTQKVTVPYYCPGVLIGNQEITRALAGSVGKEIVLGRVIRGTQGNRPFLLERLEPTDPGRELAAQVWSARQLGSFTNPTPEPLMPAQPQGAPVGQPAQYPGPYGAPNAVPQVQAQGYTMAQEAQGYTYAPAQGAPIGQQPMVAQMPPQGMQAGQQPAPAGDVPRGWDPAVWAGIPDAQKTIILQSQAQQFGTTAGAASTAGPTGF